LGKKKEVKTLKEILSIKYVKPSEEDIEKNQKRTNIRLAFLFYIPLIGVIISIILYFKLHNNWILIPFVIFSFTALWGIDGRKQICSECKKWSSVIWYDTKHTKRLVEKTEKYKDGEVKKKEEKYAVRTDFGKCTNCGKTLEKEYLKLINDKKKKKRFILF